MTDDPLPRLRALCAAHPDVVGVRLDVADADWDAIAEIVADAYRVVAAPRARR